MHPFECIYYVHIDKILRDKFVKIATQCKFIGYTGDYKGHKYYELFVGKIYVSCNVTFDELSFDSKKILQALNAGYDP